jgi:hypothetical protein
MTDIPHQEETSSIEQPVGIGTLGFMAVLEIEDDVFRGGILVTDSRGKPLEFRCTSPIHPNNVQKTLYGWTLKPHISVTLVGIPLLRGVTQSPDIMMVSQSEFLEMRPDIDKPVLLLSKQGAAMTLAEGTELRVLRELVTSPSGRFDPIVATCHWEHGPDLRIIERLRAVCSTIDLMEPFDRINTALKFVHEKGALAGA